MVQARCRQRQVWTRKGDRLCQPHQLVPPVQVNLCQKLLFLHQLTNNLTTDCSLFMKIVSSEYLQNMLCTQIVVFVLTFRTILVHNMFCRCCELLKKIYLYLGAVASYTFAILVPKWWNYSFLGTKITRGDIRLYFKTYEENYRWGHHRNIWH